MRNRLFNKLGRGIRLAFAAGNPINLSMSVVAPASATTNSAFNTTATVQNQAGATYTPYVGTGDASSTDITAILPFSFTKNADPAGAMPGTGVGCAFSPAGDYVAVGSSVTPFLKVYAWSGSAFGAVSSNPATLPDATVNGIAWHPSGTALVLAEASASFLEGYPFSAGVFGTKYADPTLPSSTQRSCAFSISGAYVFTCGTTTVLSAYAFDAVTGFGTRYLPTTAPEGLGVGVAVHPSGNFVAVSHNTTPFVSVYPWSDTTQWGTECSNPATLPAGNGRGVAFSPNGRVMVVVGINGANTYVTAYRFDYSNTTAPVGSQYSAPAELPLAQLPGSSSNNVSFSPDGKWIVLTTTTTPFHHVYRWDDESGFVFKAKVSTALASNGAQPFFHPILNHYVIAHSVSPFVSGFARSGIVFAAGTNTFSVTLKAAATHTVTVTDSLNYSLRDASGDIVASAAPVVTVYSDDFSDAAATLIDGKAPDTGANWSDDAGAAGSVVTAANRIGPGASTSIPIGNSTAADVTVVSTVTMGATANYWALVVNSASNRSAFWIVVFDSAVATGTIYLYYYDGAYNFRAQAGQTMAAATSYEITVETWGDYIQVYVDDVLKIDYYEDTRPAKANTYHGYRFVPASDALAGWDNLTVETG